MQRALPTGQAGRLLALGVTLVVLGLIWLIAVSPLLDWYGERSDALSQRRVLAERMESVAQTLPALRQSAAGARAKGPEAASLLEGGNDAIAAASLQQIIQDMASRAGASLSSMEVLPATQVGGYRRVGVHVAVSAPWPVLIHLLQAIEQASPRMVADDVQLHGARLIVQSLDPALDAGFTVVAFRAGEAPR
jgi:general secretion pathway protein M